MPAFSFRHVKDLYPIFWSKSQEMTKGISDAIKSSESGESVVEIQDWSSRATLDIIGVAGMGKYFDALTTPDNELNLTYRSIFASNRGAQIVQLLLGLLPHWVAINLPLKRNDEIGNAVNTIKKVAGDLIRDKREKLKKGEAKGMDILSVAMESGGFSDDDLVNQLMTFLAAGHETTASAMSWAVYCLCKHPDVQTRLRDELRSERPLTLPQRRSPGNNAHLPTRTPHPARSSNRHHNPRRLHPRRHNYSHLSLGRKHKHAPLGP
jgi:cytochrome P450